MTQPNPDRLDLEALESTAKAARTVLVGLYGSEFIDEPGRQRLSPEENKALGDLLAIQADNARRLQAAEAEVERLTQLINTPEVVDFIGGVHVEAVHQRERWGSNHDAGKAPLDWFWLIGYLAQKAATAQIAGDTDKALHHTISTAAALANWHAAISGANTSMRPGIEPPTPDTGEQSQ